MTSRPAAAAPPAAASGVTAKDLGLYALVVLVWGTSWIGMRWQVGVVAPEVSVLWRFAIAAPIMFVWAWAAGQSLSIPARHHAYLVGMGATMCSFNLILFYNATLLIPSGLVAVVFSLASIFNLTLGAVFMGNRISWSMIAAGAIGMSGVGLMFAPEIVAQEFDRKAVTGLALSTLATLSFCTGNIISALTQRRGVPMLSSTAWGMLYGTAILLAVSLARGQPLVIEWNARYIGALLWLALVATTIAFAAFLSLVGRIGAARAGYMTVLFPVVALAVSTVLEGYRWTTPAMLGLVLVICGNLIVLTTSRSPDPPGRKP